MFVMVSAFRSLLFVNIKFTNPQEMEEGVVCFNVKSVVVLHIGNAMSSVKVFSLEL